MKCVFYFGATAVSGSSRHKWPVFLMPLRCCYGGLFLLYRWVDFTSVAYCSASGAEE